MLLEEKKKDKAAAAPFQIEAAYRRFAVFTRPRGDFDLLRDIIVSWNRRLVG